MSKGQNTKILDCTLRDGGYYNNWDFSYSLAKKYLASIDKSGIRFVELGFRNFPQSNFLGLFAYTTDEFIETLEISKNLKIIVMINASSIISRNESSESSIKKLFRPRVNSQVEIVRIACHFNEINKSIEIAKILNNLGYRVFLNLMQANTKTIDEIKKVAYLLNECEEIEVLYFADSLGNMKAKNVASITQAIKEFWSRDIGFHSHNNLGYALSNSMVAIENSVCWIDSTILGMGRGAGNASTENLLLELQESGSTDFAPEFLFDIVLSEFAELKKNYEWGPNLAYNLSALYNIHPSYVQEILLNNNYSNKDLIGLLNFLSKIDAHSFDKNLLYAAKGEINHEGTWNAKDWCNGKEILILGSGPSVLQYSFGIENYIRTNSPVVISVNIKNQFFDDLIDLYVCANETRILNDYHLYKDLKKPIVISTNFLESVIGKKMNVKNSRDYGINISENKFTISNFSCTLPYELTIGYALSLATIGGAKSIKLVGLDGYQKNDSRQDKMNEFLEMFYNETSRDIISLTPTTYNIVQSSLFAPKI